MAGLRLTFLDSGAVVGQLGGELPDGRLPAVVSSGSCRGPFQQFERDLPAPGDDSADDAGRRGTGLGFMR